MIILVNRIIQNIKNAPVDSSVIIGFRNLIEKYSAIFQNTRYFESLNSIWFSILGSMRYFKYSQKRNRAKCMAQKHGDKPRFTKTWAEHCQEKTLKGTVFHICTLWKLIQNYFAQSSSIEVARIKGFPDVSVHIKLTDICSEDVHFRTTKFVVWNVGAQKRVEYFFCIRYIISTLHIDH